MNHKLYMEVIQNVLHGTPLSSKITSAITIEELFDFAELNKLTPFLVNILPHWPIISAYDGEFASYWKSVATDYVLREYRKFSLVKTLAERAQSANLPLIFFKGYILADLYPDFTMRTSSDTDLLVAPADFERASALLEELHYTRVTSLDTDNVFTYIYQENDYTLHKIELHTSLLEDTKGAQNSYLQSLKLGSAPKNISLTCCGISLFTLNHREHLIYQIYHMVKHLGFHGLPIRYMIDIALFIRKYGASIDWEYFCNVMDTLGYTHFWQCFASLLIQYFDLSKDILGGCAECSPEGTMDLLADMLTFGMRSKDREISHYFYYFERHVETLETEQNRRLDTITFDGQTVPYNVVPAEMQQNQQIQQRIRLLQQLDLI